MKTELTKTGHCTKHKATFVRNSFVRKTKKDYLNLKLVLGNNIFWSIIKPYFSDKDNFSNKTKSR